MARRAPAAAGPVRNDSAAGPVLATEPTSEIHAAISGSRDPGSGNIDKIRDILFGSDMREYEARFAPAGAGAAKESANLRETTRKSLESLESFVKREVEALELRFRTERDDRASSFSQVTRELKRARRGSGAPYLRSGRPCSRVPSSIERAASSAWPRYSGAHPGQAARDDRIANQRFQELHKSKTDRAALASMFTELALRLNNEMQVTGVEH